MISETLQRKVQESKAARAWYYERYGVNEIDTTPLRKSKRNEKLEKAAATGQIPECDLYALRQNG